jgi:acyl-coenzyme A synthetase/AMP-(fatty) acid ligase
MAHFYQDVLTKPTHFNFARDVVDYWAAKPGKMQAMLWISDDQRIIKSLSYEYFEVQSHRIAVLFERLGVGAGDVVLMMLPNIPEW